MEDYSEVADDTDESTDSQPTHEETVDQPDEWKQMNVRVRKGRYAKWQQAVGNDPDDEFRSMSELVRYAVEQEVSGDAGSDQPTTVDVDAEAIVDQLSPELTDIKHSIEVLSREINALRRGRRSEATEPDVTRIIWNLLPVSEHGAVSTAELSKQTGVPPGEIEEVIEEVNQRRQNAVKRVEANDDDGEPVAKFYRSE